MQYGRFGLHSRAAMVALLVGLLGLAGSARAAQTVGNFSYGQLQSAKVGAKGCGTNSAGEPAIHVSRTNNVFLGSELGVGGGSELWRGLGALGGSGASGCSLEYRGQPNAVSGVGASGGDIDVAIASAKNASGNYNLYVSSLNLASVNVATSGNNGTTFSQTPVQAGLPVDDREWIAAFGANTSLLTYHDIATNDIDVLRVRQRWSGLHADRPGDPRDRLQGAEQRARQPRHRSPQPPEHDRRVLGLPVVRGSFERIGQPQQRGVPRGVLRWRQHVD